MDVTSEYYRIFGRVERPNIFSQDDEEYYSLWESIIDSPKEKYDDNCLPFDNVKLCSLEELELIEREEVQKKNCGILDILDALLYSATLHESSLDNSLHAFYIKRNGGQNVFCNAIGRYDQCTNSFVLMAGSILQANQSYTFAHSESGMKRIPFLNKFCVFENSAYRLKQDYLCQSPSAAATLVLGRSANGWTEWKDEQKRTLDEVYRKSDI